MAIACGHTGLVGRHKRPPSGEYMGAWSGNRIVFEADGDQYETLCTGHVAGDDNPCRVRVIGFSVKAELITKLNMEQVEEYLAPFCGPLGTENCLWPGPRLDHGGDAVVATNNRVFVSIPVSNIDHEPSVYERLHAPLGGIINEAGTKLNPRSLVLGELEVVPGIVTCDPAPGGGDSEVVYRLGNSNVSLALLLPLSKLPGIKICHPHMSRADLPIYFKWRFGEGVLMPLGQG